MRTVIGIVLLLFGVVNGMREFRNLPSLPEGTDLSFMIGLFIPSLLFVAAGIYLVSTKGKR